MGCAGALYAFLIGSVNPEIFYLRLTVLTLVMLIVGGMRSLTGAVTGTIASSPCPRRFGGPRPGFDLGVVTVPSGPGSSWWVSGSRHW